MLLNRYFRNSSCGLTLGRGLAGLTLLFLLFSRCAPPHFPESASLQVTVTSDTHHDPRPCFDHEGPIWGAPSRTHFTPARKTICLCETSAVDPLRAIQKDGFHYNRPPPPVAKIRVTPL